MDTANALKNPHHGHRQCSPALIAPALPPAVCARTGICLLSPYYPPPPPLKRGPLSLYTMRGVAHTPPHVDRCPAVQAADVRGHCHLNLGACCLTQWLHKVLAVWCTTMPGMCFWFRHSVARVSLVMRELIATSMLRLHSYAHSHLPTLSLHVQLCAFYTRQVQTIGGGTLHHLAMAQNGYTRYTNCDHGNVLHASPQLVAAHGVSRGGGTGLPYVIPEGLPGTMEGI